MTTQSPICSHNPYHTARFPLLVLDVTRQICNPPNEGFRVLHWHDEIQLVYILKGVVHFKIYDQEIDLSAHDCMFINRTVLHHITEKEDCHYHSFIIPPRMLSFFPGSIMEQDDVGNIINNPFLTHYPLYASRPEYHDFFRQLKLLDELYFQEEQQAHHAYRLAIRLSQVWLELISLLPSQEASQPAKKYDRIRTMLSYIHTNYPQELSLADIAVSAHISQSECLRCFNRFIHCSPYQYLIQYRLHMSTTLLLTTERTVTEIAFLVGFHSVSSYIRYFRQYYRTTPLKYRSAKNY